MRWIVQTAHANRFVLSDELANVPVFLAARDNFCLFAGTEDLPNMTGRIMAIGLHCMATDMDDGAMLASVIGVLVPSKIRPLLLKGRHVCRQEHPTRRQSKQRDEAPIHAEFGTEATRECLMPAINV